MIEIETPNYSGIGVVADSVFQDGAQRVTFFIPRQQGIFYNSRRLIERNINYKRELYPVSYKKLIETFERMPDLEVFYTSVIVWYPEDQYISHLNESLRQLFEAIRDQVPTEDNVIGFLEFFDVMTAAENYPD